jgi:hypothetical protein
MTRSAAEAAYRYLHAEEDPELALDRDEERLDIGAAEGVAENDTRGNEPRGED